MASSGALLKRAIEARHIYLQCTRNISDPSRFESQANQTKDVLLAQIARATQLDCTAVAELCEIVRSGPLPDELKRILCEAIDEQVDLGVEQNAFQRY